MLCTWLWSVPVCVRRFTFSSRFQTTHRRHNSRFEGHRELFVAFSVQMNESGRDCAQDSLLPAKQESSTLINPFWLVKKKCWGKKNLRLMEWQVVLRSLFSLPFSLHPVLFFFLMFWAPLSLKFTWTSGQPVKRQSTFCFGAVQDIAAWHWNLALNHRICPLPPPSWCFFSIQWTATFCSLSPLVKSLYTTNKKCLIQIGRPNSLKVVMY